MPVSLEEIRARFSADRFATEALGAVIDEAEMRRHVPGFCQMSEYDAYGCWEDAFNSLKDFIDGNLPATDGTRVVEPIKNVLTKFDKVYFTLDWHPWNHCSFKANGGIWPQHCVRYTVGAALPDGILDNIDVDNVKFLPKGMAQDKEEYGQFENTKADDQDLFVKGDKVVVCGIAAEYCVLETLKNLVRLSNEVGFELSVYLEGVASIESNEPLVSYMNENNIKIYK